MHRLCSLRISAMPAPRADVTCLPRRCRLFYPRRLPASRFSKSAAQRIPSSVLSHKKIRSAHPRFPFSARVCHPIFFYKRSPPAVLFRNAERRAFLATRTTSPLRRAKTAIFLPEKIFLKKLLTNQQAWHIILINLQGRLVIKMKTFRCRRRM